MSVESSSVALCVLRWVTLLWQGGDDPLQPPPVCESPMKPEALTALGVAGGKWLFSGGQPCVAVVTLAEGCFRSRAGPTQQMLEPLEVWKPRSPEPAVALG